MSDVFVYGPLQLPAIREAILGKELPTKPAQLPGYQAKTLKELPYPGIQEQPEATVQGILIQGLSLTDLTLLDKFQEDHQRTLKEIRTEEQTVIAAVYEQRDNNQLSNENWSKETFSYTEFYLQRIIPEFFENLNK